MPASHKRKFRHQNAGGRPVTLRRLDELERIVRVSGNLSRGNALDLIAALRAAWSHQHRIADGTSVTHAHPPDQPVLVIDVEEQHTLAGQARNSAPSTQAASPHVDG